MEYTCARIVLFGLSLSPAEDVLNYMADNLPKPSDQESFEDVISHLTVKYQKLLATTQAVKAALDNLEGLNRDGSRSSPAPITKDKYKGWPLKHAVEGYVRDRPGIDMHIKQMVADLTLAGVEFGKTAARRARPEWILAQSLSQRHDLVTFDRINGIVRLGADPNAPKREYKRSKKTKG